MKPEQGEQGELYKWVKAKDRTPNHGDCFRIQWVNPYEPSHKEWIYFNGSINEYDQVYDIDNEVGEINQDTVEWLCKLSSPPPEGQDERKGGLPKSCKDKKRGRNDVCKYPIGSCELCQNNF